MCVLKTEICVHTHTHTHTHTLTHTHTATDSTPIADAGIKDESHLFVWDGEQVGGENIQVGAACEPVLLHLTYPSPSGGVKGEEGECELVSGFPKNSTLGELRVSC